MPPCSREPDRSAQEPNPAATPPDRRGRRPPPLWLFPPFLFTYAVLAIFAIEWKWPMSHARPAPLASVGIALVAAGILVVLWAGIAFRKARTPILPFREPTRLLTGGPYRFSRNPIYLAEVILLVSLVLLLGGVLAWVVPPVFAISLSRLFIQPEEAVLAERFGPAFDHYRRRVRRWI